MKELLLGTKSANSPAEDSEDTISPDGRQVAWRDKHGDKWAVLVNGKRLGGEYDEVKFIQFSPDSQHVAYAAKRGPDRARQWTVVLDGREDSSSFGGVAGIGFSPDSRRLSYIGQEKNGAVMVVDGTRGPEYKSVGGQAQYRFSEDSLHYTYAAQKGNKALVVTDGIEGPLFDDTGNPRFIGTTPYYSAKRNGAWVVMEGAKEHGPAAKGGYRILGLTPNEKKLIAVSFEGDKDRDLRLVIGGESGPLVDSITVPVQFGAVDSHFVYAAHRMKVPAFKSNRASGFVAVDGKEGPSYEALTESTLSAWLNAGQRILFPTAGIRAWFNPRWHGVSTPAATKDLSHVAYAARKGDKLYTMVVDSVEGPRFEAIPCGPVYSAEGDLYFGAFDRGRLVTFKNGDRISEVPWQDGDWTDYDGCSEFFTWSGGHWAFMAEEGGSQYYSGQTSRAKRTVVIDGSAGSQYDADSVSRVLTDNSSGGFHFFYTVHGNKATKGASLAVLDGREIGPFDDISAATARFSADGAVSFAARKGRQFLLLTVSR